jgi:hypothetical protein
MPMFRRRPGARKRRSGATGDALSGRRPSGIVRPPAMFRRAVFVTILFAGAAPAADPSLGTLATTDETKKAVISLLRHNRQMYGDDAAILQGLLLVHANQGHDAVLGTESEIVGYETAEGKKFIVFRVASGAILNDAEFDRDQRVERIWHSIVEKTLLRYPTFAVPADGIAIDVKWNHRRYASVSQLYETIDQEGDVERAKFYLHAPHITGFVEHKIAASELLGRSKVLLDDRPAVVHVTDFVGPVAGEP